MKPDPDDLDPLQKQQEEQQQEKSENQQQEKSENQQEANVIDNLPDAATPFFDRAAKLISAALTRARAICSSSVDPLLAIDENKYEISEMLKDAWFAAIQDVPASSRLMMSPHQLDIDQIFEAPVTSISSSITSELAPTDRSLTATAFTNVVAANDNEEDDNAPSNDDPLSIETPSSSRGMSSVWSELYSKAKNQAQKRANKPNDLIPSKKSKN